MNKKRIAIYIFAVQILTVFWVNLCPSYEFKGETKTLSYSWEKYKSGTRTTHYSDGTKTIKDNFNRRKKYYDFEHISVPHLCSGILVLYLTAFSVYLFRDDKK